MSKSDYVDFCYYEMPVEERRKLDVGDTFLNQGKCRECGWVIRSRNRHDMDVCKCGKSTIDGGSWYVKCSGPLDWVGLNFTDAVVGVDKTKEQNDE